MGLFRRLFGSKRKTKSTSPPSNPTPSLSLKYHDEASTLSGPIDAGSDANRHAVAVAAATAAVAEAALAAAQAAAEVVRLTNAGSSGGGDGRYGAASSAQVARARRPWLQELSAIRIQSAFRSYLARRALRALKALVKLQALVRGHIVRKKTADMLRRMQTLVRLQARARASRTRMSESWHSVGKASYSRRARCGSSANSRYFFDRDRIKSGPTWLDHWMEESLWNNQLNSPLKNRHTDDEKGDKILEVDTWMPRVKSQQGHRGIPMSQHVLASDSNSQSFLGFDSPSKPPRKMPSVHSEEVLPLNSVKLPLGDDETFSGTADNSPHMNSAASRPGSSSRKGPFTLTRSEGGSWGFFNGYSGYPSYMANTESSRAKARSQSAPRQRLELDKYGLMNRSAPDTHSEIGFSQPTQFRNKVDKASGYLKRLESGT